MNLADYQRAVMRMSFALEPNERDLCELGDPAHFMMYRQMLRGRLEGMAEIAFKRARQTAGDAAFAASFARFLAQEGARSPLIRDVIAAFGAFAITDRALLDAAPSYVPDVFAFELAKWEVAYVTARYPELDKDGLREFDFEGKPVLNPTLRRLNLARTALPYCDLEHAPAGDAARLDLLVYRPPHNEVRWWAVSPFFADLVGRFQTEDSVVVDAVRRAAHAQQRPVDEPLLEELATDLTLAVQRAVLFGVRD